VEVVDFNADAGKVYIASGYRQKSDWYRNIQKTPQIQVNFHGKASRATARELDTQEGERVLSHYAQKHPLAMKELAKFMGYEINGSDNDIRQLSHELPLIELQLG
jgi:deazaflavin-dependent oxidoreductase (nitroreductase family)